MSIQYLTFINSRDQELNELLVHKNAVKCNGFYDYVVATNDAPDLISDLSKYDSSSITLTTPKKLIQNEHPLFLANLKDTKQKNSSKSEGCYNFVGHKKDVDLENVRGYLELELEDSLTPSEGEIIPLAGKNYKPARIERTATIEEAELYIKKCKEIAEFIDDYDPTLIYAPARGAKPIIDTALRFTKKPHLTYYPVTSSFVKNGRPNNYKEIINILNNHAEKATRLLYAEEIVSGGMTQGHYNEILKAEEMRVTSTPIEIKTTGLVHRNGDKLNECLESRFIELQEQDIFFLQFVPNLFTLDDNRQLGTHYLDYEFGPHNVPYGDFDTSILGKFIKF